MRTKHEDVFSKFPFGIEFLLTQNFFLLSYFYPQQVRNLFFKKPLYLPMWENWLLGQSDLYGQVKMPGFGLNFHTSWSGVALTDFASSEVLESYLRG